MVLGKGKAPAVLRSSSKLPPLPALRVRKPTATAVHPCQDVLSSVLGCWASHGAAAANCAMLEQGLRQCMDKPKAPPPPKNKINSQLAKFYPMMVGPRRKEK